MPGGLSPWPVIHIGQQGHPVKTLQLLLRAHGHNVAVDGIFGPQTDAAVTGFQTIKGLPASGKGSNGDAVRGVQEKFQFRNGSGDPNQGLQIDGIFGPKTASTVLGFQHALSLDIPAVTVDGVVGPVTWQALVSGMLAG